MSTARIAINTDNLHLSSLVFYTGDWATHINVKSIHQIGMPKSCHTGKSAYIMRYLLAQSQYFSAAAHHFCTEILKSQLKPQKRENSDKWHSLTRELGVMDRTEWISPVQPATSSPALPCPTYHSLSAKYKQEAGQLLNTPLNEPYLGQSKDITL